MPGGAVHEPPGTIRALILPEPLQDFVPCPQPEGCVQPVSADLSRIARAADGRPPRHATAPPPGAERVRYRWYLGHHAAIAAWQSSIRLLRNLAGARSPDVVARATRLVDLYTLLLLYAGSCTPDQYAATVRADMTNHHPAFSGMWARDYEHARPLQRRLSDTEAGTALATAARTNRAVHMAVAARLVPDARSLMQQAGHDPAARPDAAEYDLHDGFFAVRRAAICRRSFNAQCLRRLALVSCDLAANGLDGPDVPALGLADRHAGHVARLASSGCELIAEVADSFALARP